MFNVKIKCPDFFVAQNFFSRSLGGDPYNFLCKNSSVLIYDSRDQIFSYLSFSRSLNFVIIVDVNISVILVLLKLFHSDVGESTGFSFLLKTTKFDETLLFCLFRRRFKGSCQQFKKIHRIKRFILIFTTLFISSSHPWKINMFENPNVLS